MRRGYLIKLGGDPEISGALAAGFVEAGARQEFRQASSDAVRRVAMMRHTPEEWAAMTEKARYDYGQSRPTPRWAECLLIGYAMLCLAVRRLYQMQNQILRRA